MAENGLTDDEWAAWNDVYQYLVGHADPPGLKDPGAETWWMKTADDASKLYQRSRGCSAGEFTRLLLRAVYEYLGEKGKGK